MEKEFYCINSFELITDLYEFKYEYGKWYSKDDMLINQIVKMILTSRIKTYKFTNNPNNKIKENFITKLEHRKMIINKLLNETTYN